MLLTSGGRTKFIVDVDFPLEPFRTPYPLRHGREKIGELLGAIEPEVIYFTDNGQSR
jgi:hypothetical protein